MATSTALTEDRAEVLVQYIRGARGWDARVSPWISKDAKRALRQQAEAFVHHVLVMQLHYFRYDQKLMRPHFLRCVEEGRDTLSSQADSTPKSSKQDESEAALHLQAARRW